MDREEALRRLGIRARADPDTIVRSYRALSRPLKSQLLHATSAEEKEASKKELGRIVQRCLAKKPDRRYQTARDVRNDLEDLQRELEWGRRPDRQSL